MTTTTTRFNNLTKREEKAKAEYIKSVDSAELELSKAKEKCTEKIYRATELLQLIMTETAQDKRILNAQEQSNEMQEQDNL